MTASNSKPSQLGEILEGRVPFVRILLLLALVGLVALDPPIMLWLLFLAYALSGPAQHFRYRRAERQAREAQDNEQ